MAEMHDTTEEYLETIFEIEEEGIVPIRARLVERLRLSAPAVSETVNRLVEQGNVELLGDRRLRLTPKGRAIARSIVRRHRLAERLLVDVIGLEWEKAHREADRWEHAISAEVEEKLVALLGDPATCPHGNPIPGSARTVDRSRTVLLSDAAPGAVVVARISERLGARRRRALPHRERSFDSRVGSDRGRPRRARQRPHDDCGGRSGRPGRGRAHDGCGARARRGRRSDGRSRVSDRLSAHAVGRAMWARIRETSACCSRFVVTRKRSKSEPKRTSA